MEQSSYVCLVREFKSFLHKRSDRIISILVQHYFLKDLLLFKVALRRAAPVHEDFEDGLQALVVRVQEEVFNDP